MRRLLLLLAVLFVPATPADAAWVWPVKGDVITPYRNGTDPYAAGQHRGIDIAASVGTPVVAAAGGDVRFAGTAGSSGLTIGIRTTDGYDISYLHLSSVAVRAGTSVSTGDRIGAVGTTGTRSVTAPHLHFGVRDAGTDHGYHDPLGFLPAPPAAPSPHPPAPAPAPAPEPVAPPPAPLTPAPALRPRTAPAGRPRTAPIGRPFARQRTAPTGRPFAPRPTTALPRRPVGLVRRPTTAPAGIASRPASTPRLRPEASPRLATARVPGRSSARPTPAALPNHGGAPSDSARERTAPPSRELALNETHHGPDIFWALACGGLLIAAAVLGLGGDGSRPDARSTLTRVLRPLAGKR